MWLPLNLGFLTYFPTSNGLSCGRKMDEHVESGPNNWRACQNEPNLGRRQHKSRPERTCYRPNAAWSLNDADKNMLSFASLEQTRKKVEESNLRTPKLKNEREHSNVPLHYILRIVIQGVPQWKLWGFPLSALSRFGSPPPPAECKLRRARGRVRILSDWVQLSGFHIKFSNLLILLVCTKMGSICFLSFLLVGRSIKLFR